MNPRLIVMDDVLGCGMALSAADFDFVRDLIRSSSAIVLDAGKEYLVEARLTPVAAQYGMPSLAEFLVKMRTRQLPQDAHHKVVQALTTNETFFFRDFHPFEAMRKEILPKLIEGRRIYKSLNIWSGASSSGQEAYSIAMLIREYFPEVKDWSVQILGTDLSENVLAQARAGRYSQLEVNRGLPAPLLFKYFTKQDDHWHIKEEIRKMTSFRPMNLIEKWMPMPVMDIVMMRNVLIYFDVETKKQILANIRKILHPSGYLFMGAAETTLNLDPQFNNIPICNTVVYQIKKEGVK